MYIIAGLGNPGKEYEGTRHNVGFKTIDALADRYNIDVKEKAHRAYIGKGMIEGQKVILVKPQTYMNLSGESIRSVMDFYKVELEHFFVIFDDISLEPGQLRIRKKGSAGGHNGIKNIIAHLGTQEFARIKVGVGAKPERMDLADYVLSRFSKGETEVMEQAYRDAAAAAVAMMTAGVDDAMNQYNGAAKKEKQKKEKEEQKKETQGKEAQRKEDQKKEEET